MNPTPGTTAEFIQGEATPANFPPDEHLVHGGENHSDFPPELVSRIRRGLDTRGYYILGKDDLSLLWQAEKVAPRDRILRGFAAALGAELAEGWTPNVALFQQR